MDAQMKASGAFVVGVPLRPRPFRIDGAPAVGVLWRCRHPGSSGSGFSRRSQRRSPSRLLLAGDRCPMMPATGYPLELVPFCPIEVDEWHHWRPALKAASSISPGWIDSIGGIQTDDSTPLARTAGRRRRKGPVRPRWQEPGWWQDLALGARWAQALWRLAQLESINGDLSDSAQVRLVA